MGFLRIQDWFSIKWLVAFLLAFEPVEIWAQQHDTRKLTSIQYVHDVLMNSTAISNPYLPKCLMLDSVILYGHACVGRA